MYKVFGDRKISIVREITKIHEEVIRTTLGQAAEKYGDGSLRGELVFVIEGAAEDKDAEQFTLEQAAELAKRLIDEGNSVSESAKQAAKATGFRKNDIYKMLIE